jgi:glutathione S-transferase
MSLAEQAEPPRSRTWARHGSSDDRRSDSADHVAWWLSLSGREILREVGKRFVADLGLKPQPELEFDEEAEAEERRAREAFSALSAPLRTEQRLIGTLLARPALYAWVRCKPDDFVDPFHARIFGFGRALSRLGRCASALSVAMWLRNVTPLLEAGDRMTPIEELVFDTLGWTFPEYILALERECEDVLYC